ncbi:MAG: CBS domain-containing protein [Planctomycetes bacterium]|nr:CBS domain-containing protein [Planctomycetota bacterium]
MAKLIAKEGNICEKISVNLDVKASDIMVSPVLTLNPDWTLTEAVRFFLEHKISGAPVVDEDGKTKGVLTLKDVSRYTMWHLETEEAEDESPGQFYTKGQKEQLPKGFHLDKMNKETVRQVMTTPVKTMGEFSTLKNILDFFSTEKFHRIFIHGKNDKIVGVISLLDVIRWLKRRLF